jgi:hypothetical protein
LDERYIELISGSLDGVLSAEERSELEVALAASPEARELMAELTADKQALRTMPGLMTPPQLKQQTLLKARAASPGGGAPWHRLLLAASVLLVLGLSFFYLRPLAAARHRFHLRPGNLAMKAARASEELSLAAAEANRTHLLTSESVSGKYLGGPTRLHLHCDAGKLADAKLQVSLAFDFDGDGKFDTHSEPRELQLDQNEGFEELACLWEEVPGMRDLENGKVQVQLTNPGQQGPLKLKFEPELARLELPFDKLEGPTELSFHD